MPRSRQQPSTPIDATTCPEWLVHLHDDLFARILPEEPAWEWQGTTYHCVRVVQVLDGEVWFQEEWLDQVTRAVRQRWRERIDGGAFVGLHDSAAWNQTMEFLVNGLLARRPLRAGSQSRAKVFDPGRFKREMGRQG